MLLRSNIFTKYTTMPCKKGRTIERLHHARYNASHTRMGRIVEHLDQIHCSALQVRLAEWLDNFTRYTAVPCAEEKKNSYANFGFTMAQCVQEMKAE